MIDKITNFVIIGGIIIVILAVIIFLIFYINKKNMINKGRDYSDYDYSSFERHNTKDYIQIDDIVDDVIICDNYTRFVGVIDCAGIDFYDFSLEEQLSTAKNFLPFIQTITTPITYRQYCSSSDLEDTILRYQAALKTVADELSSVYLQIDGIIAQMNNDITDNEKGLLSKKLEEFDARLKSLDFRRIHILDQLKYIETYSGNNVAPVLSSTYVFDWSTSSLDAADIMSKEEVFQKASQELNTIAAAKIHSLSLSGVVAKRCPHSELIDMFRRHSLPVSSERFKKRDVEKIEFDADIISSNSIEKYSKLIETKRIQAIKNSADDVFNNDTFNNMFNKGGFAKDV